MEIVKLKDIKFGTPALHRLISGYAFFEPDKGFLAFSHDRDQYGILVPYIPCGGKKALQSILDAGGFLHLDGMEYVNSL